MCEFRGFCYAAEWRPRPLSSFSVSFTGTLNRIHFAPQLNLDKQAVARILWGGGKAPLVGILGQILHEKHVFSDAPCPSPRSHGPGSSRVSTSNESGINAMTKSKITVIPRSKLAKVADLILARGEMSARPEVSVVRWTFET
jgi:hypothetical protein